MPIKIYFKKLRDTLVYFDFQPLLFFWISSDTLNTHVLWTTHKYWVEAGQGDTYFLYLAFLVFSLSMLISIHKYKRMIYFVSGYLCLYLFSTIRYLLNIDWSVGFEIIDYKNLLITIWYALMWIWIWFKIKNEILHKEINKL